MNRKWNLFLLVVLFATFSCNQEEVGPDIFTADSEGDIQEVTIKITVPFEESRQLRSIGPAEENTIHTIDVLAFRVNEGKAYFDYSVEGKKEADNTINTVLWTRSAQQCLVIITNARDEVRQLFQSAGPAGWKGTEKNAMLERLEFSLAQQGDKWNTISASNYTAFPMYGESEAVTVTKQTAELDDPVSLIRMVAKINVQLDENISGLTDKFKMKSVRLYNTLSKGRIIPKEAENGIVTKASVPAVAEKDLGPLFYNDFSDPGKEDIAVRGSIYTFETVAAAANKASEATCLVVGGCYYKDENKETYYRLDFINKAKEFIDILRNHQYIVNIKDVTGSGYDTPEEAFEAKSTNMSVDVLNWNDNGMHNVVFDGQFFLSISRSVFNFSREAYTQKGTNNVLAILTNYKTLNGTSGWYIEKIDAGDGVSSVEWLELVDNEGNPIEQGEPDVEKELILYLKKNDTGSDRTAILTFASGRLRYAVTVTQTTRELTSINFYEGHPNDDGLSIDTLKFYHDTGSQAVPKHFTVRWTPKDSDLVVYEAPVMEDLLPVASIVPELRVVSNKPGYYDYEIVLKYNKLDIGKATSLVFLVSNGVEMTERKLVIYYYPQE